MKLHRASDYKRMPWKNGGGETVEIAVFPPDASIDDFDWRISMATVASDGPFSIFPGIDRTLSILDGSGISLAIGTSPAELLTRQSEPTRFAADVAVDATLNDGPTTDLNVMTRRHKFSNEVKRLSGEIQLEKPEETDVFLLLATGPLSVEADGETVDLDVLDAVWIEEKTHVEARNTVYYVIRLSRL